jgi:hypothetical protein
MNEEWNPAIGRGDLMRPLTNGKRSVGRAASEGRDRPADGLRSKATRRTKFEATREFAKVYLGGIGPGGPSRCFLHRQLPQGEIVARR